MHFPTALVTLLAVTVAAKKQKDGEGESEVERVQDTCRRIVRMEHFVKMAQNETEVDIVTNHNATEAAELKAKAADAQTKLNNLTSNSTLMTQCASVDAQDGLEQGCRATGKLQDFLEFAHNSTAVAEATNNNQTRIDRIAADAEKAKGKLDQLMANHTLQDACPAIDQKDQCKNARRFANWIADINNQTKLDEMTHGNASKAAEMKKEAGYAQEWVTELAGNRTFMEVCDKLGIEIKGMEETTHGGISSRVGNGGNVAAVQMSLLMAGVLAVGMLML